MTDHPTTTNPTPPSPPSRHFFQFSSDNFLLAAGGVLFRLAPTTVSDETTETLQICILHHSKRNQWVLPKGRKDVNESLESAALREVFEETGYACEPLPCPMFTRAPNTEVYTGLKPHVEPASTEPFTITFRLQKDGSMKFIHWYLMRVVSNSAPRVQGTQMPNECFEPHFVSAREAVQQLTQHEYRSVVSQAVNLVENAMTMSDCRPVFNP